MPRLRKRKRKRRGNRVMTDNSLRNILEKFESSLNFRELLKWLITGVVTMKDDLDGINYYLRKIDAAEVSHGDRTRARHLREIAYDLEDVINEFMLDFGRSHGSGVRGWFRRIYHYARNLGSLYRIVSQMYRIKTRHSNILLKGDSDSVNLSQAETSSHAARNRLHDGYVASVFADESELVGIDVPRRKLIGYLVDGAVQRKVISVVGMVGVGKTTLVRKVYDTDTVKGWFACHAWIIVTQSFTIEEILRNIINQMFQELNEQPAGRIDTMQLVELTQQLRSFLRDKRYVVVLDDLSNSNAWDVLNYALPDNRRGSRILVTTRNRYVGSSFQDSDGIIYDLQPLSKGEAWNLFCRKAFRSLPSGECPPELKDLSHKIVNICDGLPLVIAAIGGLLSKKEKTFLEWKKMHDNLSSELAKTPELTPVSRLLLSSYNDLPYSLKSCCLYFSIFPRGYEIKRITLIRLWIAEGFIESGNRKTMEDVAEDYFNDLIDRNLVQVAALYDYGRVRSCRVHDLIREIIIMKSEEENFSTSVIRRNTQTHETVRRLSTHGTIVDDLEHFDFSHLRALFLFGPNASLISYVHRRFSTFRLLKVLDLEGAPMKNFRLDFANLRHLRYLSLRNTMIKELPKSHGELRRLETLDLKGTHVSELPEDILKLKRLRHLLAYHNYTRRRRHSFFHYTSGVKVPQGIGGLRELQKLTYLEASEDSSILTELGNLTQLKRLGVVQLTREDGVYLCASIEKMTSLESLSLTSAGMDVELNLNSLSSPPPFLQRLYLRGPLQALPNWIPSLKNLVRMRLRWCRLGQDSLGALQDLPNLIELTLIKAYNGILFCCRTGGFRNLRVLDLEELDDVKCVVLNGAMPKLEKMYIADCKKLLMVPLGIQHLMSLKELHLYDMREEFVGKIRRYGTDWEKVRRIPVVRCYRHQEGFYEDI